MSDTSGFVFPHPGHLICTLAVTVRCMFLSLAAHKPISVWNINLQIRWTCSQRYDMSWEIQPLGGLSAKTRSGCTRVPAITCQGYTSSHHSTAPSDGMCLDSVKSSYLVGLQWSEEEGNKRVYWGWREMEWPTHHLSMKQAVCFSVQRFSKWM